jgi:hypothetical protein
LICPLSIFVLVDDAHPAASESLDDAAVRDGFADHAASMLWRQRRQVNENWGVGGISSGLLALNPDSTHHPRLITALMKNAVDFRM